jgi:hypothetical protein
VAALILFGLCLLGGHTALAADAGLCTAAEGFHATPSTSLTYPPPWVAEFAAFIRAHCPNGSRVRVPNHAVAETCDLNRPMEQTRHETVCFVAPH